MELVLGELIENKFKITEKLGEGGIAVVYKATNILNNKNFALKFLKPGKTSSFAEDQIRFKKEVEIVRKFNHLNIVKLEKIGEYKNNPYIVMELLEGESLHEILKKGKKFSFMESVHIIKQLAGVLGYVHSCGIIHRDLKPGNIMIENKTNRIKLLDFSLSHIMELSEIKNDEEIIGTFGYMSPESTGIINKPVDERSDLYSLGIIFYRLITNEIPFKGKKTSEILHQQAALIPENPNKINSNIPKALENIIMKLLEKEPDLRYQSAIGLVYDLERYEKGERNFVIGEGDKKVKLSYNVKLIGREQEIKKIKVLYNKAKISNGSMCFIIGESGLGKSRLIEDMRVYAYEQGDLFFTGRCLAQENKIPYQPFKDIIDEYIRKIKSKGISAKNEEKNRIKKILGELSRIIATLNPDMIEILGETPELEQLDPERENKRFLLACAKFFCNLTDKSQCVIFFIDDLHWVDEASLRLLEEILNVINTSNLLILSTLNQTKSNISLNNFIRKAKEDKYALDEISLNLLDFDNVKKLLSEVLCEREERTENLTKYILNQTKGNPFFTITLLRELVERNALIWKDGHWEENWTEIKKLPISTNIVDIVLLRIKELPDIDKLLKICSVLGKEFELYLLSDLMQEDNEKIVNLIDEAIKKQLLERKYEKGKIAFIHDRIKDAFYARIDPEERKQIHLKIGYTIEKKYNIKKNKVIFDLAHHYIEGGNEEKGYTFALPSAEIAKNNHANKEAIKYFKYVKNYLAVKREKANFEIYINVVENLGDVLRLEGIYDEALENFNEAETLVKTNLLKGRLSKKIGETLFQMGRVTEAILHLEKSLKILRLKAPKSRWILIYLILEIIKQSLHRLFPSIFLSNKYINNEEVKIGVGVYFRLAYCYYFIDIIKSSFFILVSMNITDKMVDTPEYCWVHTAGGSGLCVSTRLFKLGENYVKDGERIAHKIKNGLMEGFAYVFLGYLYHASNRVNEALENSIKGINILLSYGERWEIAVAYYYTVTSNMIKGNFKESIKIAEEFILLMKQVKDFRTLAWSFTCYGKILTFAKGVDNETMKILFDALEYAKKAGEIANIPPMYSALAYAFLENENYKEAIENGEEGVEIFMDCHAKGYWGSDIFAVTADCYLTKIEKENLSESEYKKYLTKAESLCKQALKWGKRYKVFLGTGLRVTGKYYWLKGEKTKAIKCFNSAIDFLTANQYQYELGLIYLEYGNFVLKEDIAKSYNNYERGNVLLFKAKEIFSKIEAVPALKKINHILGIYNTDITKE
ncbi:protein kinase [Candidatus Poribacteria bacterium]|nr:protein kinase [Candidatus Poribacteria bacterium]